MKTTKLLDVADIIYGYAFDSKLFNTSGEGRPLIRIRDVNTGFSNTYTTENAPEKYLVRNGDFLIGMDGNFEIVKWTNGDALLNQRVCKIIPKSIKPDYLFYLLSPILKNIEDKAHSTTVKHLSAKELNKISFELPNGDQQSKIANELSNLHSMLELKREALEGLDSLVKSRFMEMFGDVTVEQKNTIKLGSICKTMGGGTPTTKKPEYYEGNIPWISTVSLGPNYIDGSDAKGYITNDAIINSATKLIPAYSVMVGTRVGVGKSSVNTVPICTNQDINSITGLDSKKYIPLFIKYVVDAYQSYFDSIKKGATILGINSDDLKNINVPNVSIDLQKEFVSFVEQIDKSRFVCHSRNFL